MNKLEINWLDFIVYHLQVGALVGKDRLLTRPMAHKNRAYPNFRCMKRIEVFLILPRSEVNPQH